MLGEKHMHAMPDPLPTGDASPHPSQIKTLPRRLAFLEIDEADRERLHSLAERLNAKGEAFVETFYRHLFKFEETARFLKIRPSSPAQAGPAGASRIHARRRLGRRLRRSPPSRGRCARHGRHQPANLSGRLQPVPAVLHSRTLWRLDGPAQAPPSKCSPCRKPCFWISASTLEAYFSQATQSLRKAFDLVFQANSELRQFAQLTSHDLKTPLATMANLCDEALDEFREPDAGGSRQADRGRPHPRLSA